MRDSAELAQLSGQKLTRYLSSAAHASDSDGAPCATAAAQGAALDGAGSTLHPVTTDAKRLAPECRLPGPARPPGTERGAPLLTVLVGEDDDEEYQQGLGRQRQSILAAVSTSHKPQRLNLAVCGRRVRWRSCGNALPEAVVHQGWVGDNVNCGTQLLPAFIRIQV